MFRQPDFRKPLHFSGSEVPLEQVFKEVKKQTGYVFFYDELLIQKTKPVSVKAVNQSLSEFLDNIFRDQPLKYKLKNKNIIVAAIEKEVTRSIFSDDNPPVTGVVRGPDGQPIAGVNVVVKGTKRGVVTDAYGRFTIEAEQGKTLVVSNIGYNSREITVNRDNNMIVALEISTSKLDEVQIIAYGETSKRLQTGNISTVKGEDIAKQPVNNPLLALQGRVPGLLVTQSNGLPGGGIKVRIQGQNSIRSGTAPLYVVDGVPYPSELPPGVSIGPLGNSGGLENGAAVGTGNALAYINPSDIESIDVLKDADATAIYGSRAANGAILITTKKGKAGKATFDVNLQHGWASITRKLNMLNSRKYLEMRHEAFVNDATTPSTANAPDLFLWDTTRYTDWQKVLIGGTAHYTNINASLSGGTPAIQYLIRGTFQRETSVLPKNFSDRRGSLHFSINSTTTNQKFSFQLLGNYLVDNNHLPVTDLTQYAIALPQSLLRLIMKMVHSTGCQMPPEGVHGKILLANSTTVIR